MDGRTVKRRKRQDTGVRGALPLDSLSSLCSCSMGTKFAGGENVLDGAGIVSFMGKGELYALTEVGNWGTGT